MGRVQRQALLVERNVLDPWHIRKTRSPRWSSYSNEFIRTICLLFNRLSRAPVATGPTWTSSIGCCFRMDPSNIFMYWPMRCKNESGRLEYVGAVSDVTATKVAEEKIRRSEAEFRQIVDAIPATDCRHGAWRRRSVRQQKGARFDWPDDGRRVS